MSAAVAIITDPRGGLDPAPRGADAVERAAARRRSSA